MNATPRAAAYLADDRPVSREAFYAIACDPGQSVVVEACAGAGKTWMLVSRILRALLGGAEPHEILAITFTRKAAGEMRERLNDWLREFGAPHTPESVRIEALVQRGVPLSEAHVLAPQLANLRERLLGGGRPVEIRTFHAWFSQLLRAAPLELLGELGLQQDMALIEGLDDHLGEVFRRFHAAVLAEPALRDDYFALTARRGRSQLRKWLTAALDKRVEFELADAAGVLEASVPPPELDDGLKHPTHALLGAAWHDSLRELAIALARGNARAQDAATGLVLAIEQQDAAARYARAWAALFTDKGTPRKLGDLGELARTQDELAAIGQQIHQHEAHLEHLRMVRLARVLLVEFADYKRTRGLADMSDLERCGLALLRDASLAGWVQERLDARIRHVLIDEFQDTSPLQWHALNAWLSAYAGAGGGTSGQRPPGVFIVGDPKQSIYRFRRAEPRVFEAARGFVVEALGGRRLACDHTRRNAPEVLTALNTVFLQAQAAGEFDGFRAHTTEVESSGNASVQTLPVVPRPPRVARGAPPEPAVWRDTLTTPRHEPEALLREQEAAFAAAAIRDLVSSGQAAPAEIFVLSRKRQSLRLVAQALRQVQVPFAASEDAALMDAPEALDLVALLDALVSPQHRLSLAQALRSPVFGASDADLIALAQRADGVGGDWWRALVEGEPHASDTLMRARALLPRWRAASAALPPHDLLDRIVFEGEVRERVAATVPPTQRAAALDSVDAVLAQALTLDSARYATPYNFVRALKRRAIRTSAPVQADAVQLLTVHGAKGLEAKVVFVMDADPQPKNPDTATLLIDWPVESDHPQRCAFVYAESACPPALLPLLEAERAARRREELNGLYVAMSRARERLVFSATEPSRRALEPAWWARVAGLANPLTPAVTPRLAIANSAAAVETLPVRLKVLIRATPIAVPLSTTAASRSPDTEATRLGSAVHRVLEWSAWPNQPTLGLQALALAAATEFGAAAGAVARSAEAILGSAASARFFGGAGLRWAGNEVPVADAGELLRIDRLVQLERAGESTWWVLDYKLAHAPQQLEIYRAQLHRYRAAVQRAQPGEAVRCAFITGAGEVIEID